MDHAINDPETEYKDDGLVSDALQKEYDRLTARIKKYQGRIAALNHAQPLKKILEDEEKQRTARKESKKELESTLHLLQQHLKELKADHAQAIKDIKKAANLRGTQPNFAYPSLKKMEEEITQKEAEIAAFSIPSVVDRTRELTHEWNVKNQTYLRYIKKIEKLRVLMKDVETQMERDRWTPAYKQYAEDNDLEDIDDLNIFSECNAHWAEKQIISRTTVPCTCYNECSVDDCPGEHTYTFGDIRCTYGTKMYISFSEKKIGFIGRRDYFHLETRN